MRRSALLPLLIALLTGGCDAAPEGGVTAEQDGARASADTAEGDPSLPVDASLTPGPGDSGPGDLASVPPGDSDQLAEARQRIVDYYAAIDAGDHERAYAAWGDEGRASGQTYLEFVAGFAATTGVDVEVGEPGRMEGAAGSRYVEIPVVVTARTEDGERQRFEGTYTLRRSVVDGATESQRRWHLNDASLQQVR